MSIGNGFSVHARRVEVGGARQHQHAGVSVLGDVVRAGEPEDAVVLHAEHGRGHEGPVEREEVVTGAAHRMAGGVGGVVEFSEITHVDVGRRFHEGLTRPAVDVPDAQGGRPILGQGGGGAEAQRVDIEVTRDLDAVGDRERQIGVTCWAYQTAACADVKGRVRRCPSPPSHS